MGQIRIRVLVLGRRRPRIVANADLMVPEAIPLRPGAVFASRPNFVALEVPLATGTASVSSPQAFEALSWLRPLSLEVRLDGVR